MRKTKQLVFTGEHPRLITGAEYTLYAVALLTGVSDSTLYRRLQGKDEITSWDITPASERNPKLHGKQEKENAQFNRLESKADRLSAAWLRVSLCQSRRYLIQSLQLGTV